MKTKIISIFLLAIFCCVAIASNNDIRSAERGIKNAQSEISQLASQKRAAEAKLQKAEAELQDATAKMEKNKDKPKSLPYKNAVKKAETSQKKIGELQSTLQSIEADIMAKNAEVLNYQQVLLSAKKAQNDDAAVKKQAKEDAKLAKQREKDSIKLAKQQAKEERLAKQREPNNVDKESAHSFYQNEEGYSETKSNIKSASSTSSDDNNLPAWFWISLIVLGAIMGWRNFKRKHHCPNCGKWFTLESEGDTRKWEHNSSGDITKRGAMKHYRCTNCGHPVQFIEWFHKK